MAILPFHRRMAKVQGVSAMTNQPTEAVTSALRSLYSRYGYSRYKMNKFEEYDLYAKNKDFLISDSVITFTDTNGKLMALKPDVTLSIVKNTRDEPGIRKLYYNENVYRVSKGTHSFKEIMQVGLEAIGEIDEYCIYEVLKLAAESLKCTGRSCILEISHLGLLSDAIRHAGVPETEQNQIIRCIGEKNLHELQSICRQLGVSQENTDLLRRLSSLYGTPDEVLPTVQALLEGIGKEEELAQFLRIISALNAGKYRDLIRIDFSAVSDPQYYNGFVFKGFAQGVPSAMLSGGQYDSMMKKMKRQSGAIGFAVYLDILEQYTPSRAEYDVDTLLLYDEGCSIPEIEAEARQLTGSGESILLQRQIPPGIRYRQLVTMKKGRA